MGVSLRSLVDGVGKMLGLKTFVSVGCVLTPQQAMKNLQHLLGFYSITTEVALMDQAQREVRRATWHKMLSTALGGSGQ